MILNFMAADRALAKASAEPVIEGSRGQPAPNPGFGIAERCDKTALKIARELGLMTAREDADDDGAEDDELDALDRETTEDELARRRARSA